MKPFALLLALTAFCLPACGSSDAPADDQVQNPLEEVPNADDAAAEADAINADNADQTLADLEKEMNDDQ